MLTKKQLKNIADTYNYYLINDPESDFLVGYRQALIAADNYIQVKNELFRRKNHRYAEQLDTACLLLKKAYQKNVIDITHIKGVLDQIEIDCMEKLNNEEKKQLAACLLLLVC